MCGIVGWANLDEDLSNQYNIINEMSKTLSKRGPDESGTYFDLHVALAHRRLTVVDPEGGMQPMRKKFNDVNYIIVYNGELYNTDDIRKELIELGHTFKSHSDTEVLLTSFIEWGYECTNKLNGIFAFAIWNDKKNELFICRDRLGVKPLFYSLKNNSLIFASEIKALLKHPQVSPVLDKIRTL